MEPLTNNAVDDEDDIMGHGNGSTIAMISIPKSISRSTFFGGRISLTRRELGVLGTGQWCVGRNRI
jgi:hypothetical protein